MSSNFRISWIFRAGPCVLLALCCSFPLKAQGEFIRGDVNGDGGLDLGDPVATLLHLFAGAPAPACEDAADSDDDGIVEIPDAIVTLGYLFLRGAPPREPFPRCGLDPTPDALDCAGPVLACLPTRLEFTSIPLTLAHLEGEYRYPARVEDPTGGTVSYALMRAPAGAGVDDSSGLVTWTPAPDQLGAHTFVLRATSTSGSSAEQVFAVRVRPWPAAPRLDSLPGVTREATIRLTGTAPGAVAVEIRGGREDLVAPVEADDRFELEVSLIPDSVNRLFVTAIDAEDLRSAPAITTLTQDGVPPRLHVDVPVDGSQTLESAALLAGRVSDQLSGFRGLQVSVEGVDALVEPGIGTNGTWLASLPTALEVGENELVVRAVDAAGNETTTSITITRGESSGDRPGLEIISGNEQTARMRSDLPDPVVVRVLDAGGQPFANKLVTFRVTRSDGRLREVGAPGESGSLRYQTFTDAAGEARCQWRVGTDAGSGNNRLEVTSRGCEAPVQFCASASEGPPAQINIAGEGSFRGEVGARSDEPLRVRVSDGCNGVAGVPVTFTVVEGSGLVNGEREVTVPSESTGHAEVQYTHADRAGLGRVVVDFPGRREGAAAQFILEAVERREDGSTSFRAVVVDNDGEPIEGALGVLEVGEEVVTATSDEAGQLEWHDLPGAGRTDFFVHGGTAFRENSNEIPEGTFPTLLFHPVLVPGADNELGMPVRLPRLRESNRVVYSETAGAVLTVEGIEGLRMVVPPGSLRTPDGRAAPDGTILSLDTVHPDDIPMSMNDGASPPFAWTLQPGGYRFDPPVRVEVPNMSGLPPGAIGNFLTFDHDTGKFEIFATGAVSEDGSLLVTDPGEGLRLAGWGGTCPPYSARGEARRCEFECFSPTDLSGGSASVTPSPELGEMIEFVAAGASDPGGTQVRKCRDGSEESVDIPPAAIQYSWTITTPTGVIVAGEGPIASVLAEECGEYSCDFVASVERPCTPEPIQIDRVTTTVVEGFETDPEDQPPISLRFSRVCNSMSILETLGSVPPLSFFCDFTAPPECGSATIDRTVLELCCDDGGGLVPRERERLKPRGIQGGPLGSFDCGLDLLGFVPFVDVELGGGARASWALGDTPAVQSCESDTMCLDAEADLQMRVQLSAEILHPRLASVRVHVAPGFAVDVEACTEGGGTDIEATMQQICLSRVTIGGSWTILGIDGEFDEREVRRAEGASKCLSGN